MAGKPPSERVRRSAGAIMVDLTHARHDRAHVLAPGLFRSLGPGDRKKLKLDVTYQFSPDEQIEFKGFEPLGVMDMRVLQGIVAMAGPDGLLLEDEDRATDAGQQLMLSLFEPADVAIRDARKKPPSLVVRDSLRHLAREIGLAESGTNLKRIRKSVERLFGVSVFIQKGKKRLGTRLLSSYASDDETGDLYVALNPRLASAILGRAPYARIDLAEVRALDSDPARLMHQRLSGWIDPGKSGEVTADTLSGYVWPDKASEAQMRWRKAKVRKAVAEIEAAGWRVDEIRKDHWRFIRPRIK